jgi:DNA-binding CsgD family transcriptional regulator
MDVPARHIVDGEAFCADCFNGKPIFLSEMGNTGEKARRQRRVRGISLGGKMFTVRQHQVRAMAVQGKSNKEIAVALGITVRTVKHHIGAILQKYGVQSRHEFFELGTAAG